MKTAVEWVVEQLARKHNEFQALTFYYDHKDEIEQAKAMEKDQICNAYTDGLEGPYLGAEEYYIRTYNQKGIDAGTFIADLLTKDLEELGDEDLEPREDNRVNELLNEYKIPQTRERLPELRDQESNSQDLAIDPVLRLKEDYDPNTINFRWNDTEEVILKISKEGFYYRGELVEDIHNVYERFNEWLTKIE